MVGGTVLLLTLKLLVWTRMTTCHMVHMCRFRLQRFVFVKPLARLLCTKRSICIEASQGCVYLRKANLVFSGSTSTNFPVQLQQVLPLLCVWCLSDWNPCTLPFLSKLTNHSLEFGLSFQHERALFMNGPTCLEPLWRERKKLSGKRF